MDARESLHHFKQEIPQNPLIIPHEQAVSI